MFKFSRKSATAAAPEFSHSMMPSAANSSQAANDIQRELIRVAFQDTVRATGMPSHLLDCAVRYIKAGKSEERVQIQLVMQQWNEHLLRYSLAFQNELVKCLDRYEPGVDHTQHEWLWRYAANVVTPFPELPLPGQWAAFDAPRNKAAPLPQRREAAIAAPVKPKTAQKDFELRDIFSGLTADSLQADRINTPAAP
jgi:hypothetical protein